jgi:glycosyltransferase involved in cell wall biosynthesis
MRRIKVLIFINSFRAGGSERQALEVIRRLDRTRYEPFVACFQKEGPLLSELPADIGVIHTFPLQSFFSWASFKQGMAFSKLIQQAGIQIIQCFDFYSNLFAVPWGRISGIPIILGARRDEASMRTPGQHRTELLVYKLANGVIANAENIKDQLVVRDKVISDKVWVIQNGLDLDRFDGRRQHSLDSRKEKGAGPSVAVVANLRPEKGHLVLLEACRHLADRFSTLKVFIVGNGPIKELIAQRISELKLTHCVEMTGELKNVPAFFEVADIAVLPSLKNEGFPNSVMEAMAASLPVVATDTGGTGELVIDGLTGYLVPAGDPEALQNRLGKLCADPELRNKMGEAGRQRIIERFTADRMVRRFESLYEVLLKTSCRIRA